MTENPEPQKPIVYFVDEASFLLKYLNEKDPGDLYKPEPLGYLRGKLRMLPVSTRSGTDR